MENMFKFLHRVHQSKCLSILHGKMVRNVSQLLLTAEKSQITAKQRVMIEFIPWKQRIGVGPWASRIHLALGASLRLRALWETNFQRSKKIEKMRLNFYFKFLIESRNRGPNRISIKSSSGHVKRYDERSPRSTKTYFWSEVLKQEWDSRTIMLAVGFPRQIFCKLNHSQALERM